MKREIGLWQLGGFVFTAALGTVLHFLYGWTDNVGVAVFSAVNESTWEHMKLVFYPAFVFAVIQSRFFASEYQGFWWVKLQGILLGTLLVPILFYTYNGVFGQSPDWLNILFFFVAVACAFIFEGTLLKKGGVRRHAQWVAVVLLILIVGLFVTFTFATPRLPLFKDPLTGGYGLGT